MSNDYVPTFSTSITDVFSLRLSGAKMEDKGKLKCSCNFSLSHDDLVAYFHKFIPALFLK